MSYSKEILEDPRWKEKRMEIWDLRMCDDENTWSLYEAGHCEMCGHTLYRNSDFRDKSTIWNLHHKKYLYTNGEINKPWDYPSDLLIILCVPCHEKVHENNKYFYVEDRIKSIKYYAKYNKWFNTDFVDSVWWFYCRNGYITENQNKSILSILKKLKLPID